MPNLTKLFFSLCAISGLFATPSHGQPSSHIPPLPSALLPKIVIIIDDVGHQWTNGVRAINLPGQVAYAILPHTPFSTPLARLAHQHQKEVLVHLPMEPVGDHSPQRGMLTLPMLRNEFVDTLRDNLRAIPHARGVNNHMGSLLTQHPGHMKWLMEELYQRGNLFFVDSRTTSRSVALKTANSHQIPHLGRDIFLDHDREPHRIAARFNELIASARQTGQALAIGHPYPETLSLLENELSRLDTYGVQLISPLQAIAQQEQRLRFATGPGAAPIEGDTTMQRAPVIAHQTPLAPSHQ